LRIGIVGSGIAGLTAGWKLQRDGHRVTIFEKHDSLGMDAHSIDFAIDGKTYRSDVPPRMFNDSLWPSLCRLYDQIGVAIESVSPTKSFSGLADGAVLRFGNSYLPKLSPSLTLSASCRSILKEIGRMTLAAPGFIENPTHETIGQYLQSNQYSDAFIKEFLYPALSSTVCTCSYESLDAYPAKVLIESMLKISKPEGLFRTTHGTRDVVNRLAKDIDGIQLGTPVGSVTKKADLVVIETENGDSFEFENVVVATQANSVGAIVDGLTELEQSLLNTFEYENVRTVVHTDDSLMPKRRSDWSNFNLISNESRTAAMCSIWLNEFYPEWHLETPVFQTIMPWREPGDEALISTSLMQRPVVNASSIEACQRLGEHQNQSDRRIWFCGSYATTGVPLLESGVRSSLDVCERMQALSPFAKQI